jgi:hypothetical protein
MPDKNNEEKHADSGPGLTGLMIGTGAVLALSALDGGILTVVGCGALAYGTHYVVSRVLTPDDAPADSDRFERDLGFAKYIISGACALSVFLNPFVGIPGTVVVLLLHRAWKKEVSEFIRESEEKLKQAAEAARKAGKSFMKECAA